MSSLNYQSTVIVGRFEMSTLIFHLTRLPEERQHTRQRLRGQRLHKEKKEPNKKNSADNRLTADKK